jgi:hypothetical protein
MGNRALTITALVLSLPVIAHAKISYANSEAQKPGIVKAAPNAAADVVLVGAGDIASCDDLAGAKATAKLIDEIPELSLLSETLPQRKRRGVRQLLHSDVGTIQRPHSSCARQSRIPQRRRVRLLSLFRCSSW